MVKMNILKQMVHDIKSLFAKEGEAEDSDAVYLWDNKSGKLRMGIRMETILKKVNNGSCNAD